MKGEYKINIIVKYYPVNSSYIIWTLLENLHIFENVERRCKPYNTFILNVLHIIHLFRESDLIIFNNIETLFCWV